ncbi:class I SAM-dependent methyltransferase [Streptomonospora nanhaiensis]|uniref:class I SAM-dependent methyltransferase n=1 Tax=Streptomonospora nanhaiensis TaxID=1323731 RepID=UPI001C99FCC2|nr:class I SAM-dependent methyltransferase [Streptomonospora nanhaiensis]MBX9387661.1 class I SAM-dependent methyltransferase [Streptomonospora nanhaiensis]
MSTVVNTEQARAWNGYEGTHWAEHQARYDAVNSGFNEPLLAAAAIGAGDRVLDIGCGNGQLTRLAARRAAGGSALGVDLSGPMLARARATAAEEGVANVAFEQGDAQVHPFAPGGFDAALSRFGVMFFADPVAAFANISRALRPGGRLALLFLRGMDHNDLGTVFAAAAPHLPVETGDDGVRGAVSMADPDRVRDVLAAAGFTGIGVREVRAPQVWGADADDAGAFLSGWGPVRHLLDQVDAAAAAKARAAITEALRGFEAGGAVRLTGSAWLATARLPEG